MRAIVEDYYDIQKMRIEVEGQVRAVVQGKAEGNDAFLRENVLPRLRAIEKDIIKFAKEELENHDIWTEWLKGIKGVGPLLAGGLIAWVEDPAKFNYPSALWKYSGLDVVNGEARRRKRGEKICWNPRLKTLCWKLGESFVKVKNKESGYGALYDQFREFYDNKYPKLVEVESSTGKKYNNYTKGHKHAMAKRKVVKIFLCHFLNRWKELRGLEPSKPWINEHGGHKDYIEPFSQ